MRLSPVESNFALSMTVAMDRPRKYYLISINFDDFDAGILPRRIYDWARDAPDLLI